MRLFLALILLCTVYSQHYGRKRYKASVDMTAVMAYPLPTPAPETETSTSNRQPPTPSQMNDKKSTDNPLESWLLWAFDTLPTNISTTPPTPRIGEKKQDVAINDTATNQTGDTGEQRLNSTDKLTVDGDTQRDALNTTLRRPQLETKKSNLDGQLCFYFPGKYDLETLDFFSILNGKMLKLNRPQFYKITFSQILPALGTRKIS
jgi:hypothetical protein